MPSSSSPELFPQKSLKIKQDDKFFSRLLSKENSSANPSFRVYYGNVSSSVPFTWEIQPGTPKHKFSDNSIPPLTPPPSYYTSNLDHQNTPTKRKYLQRSSMLIYKLLLSMNLIKKGHVEASPSSSSSSSISSSSWSSSLSSTFHYSSSSSSKGRQHGSKRRRVTSFGSSFDDDGGHIYGGGSPDDSVKCFGMNDNINKDSGNNNGSYTMKKAFLSIVGRRSAG